jgi:alkaline phosphatase D
MKITNLFSILLLVIISPVSFSQFEPALEPFYHGVASGDPATDRVILWTKVTPDGTVLSGDPIQVQWRIATDTAMTNIVNNGTGNALEANDYTFKIDATGLSANGCYYYDFYALGKYSIRGRTFTTPSGNVDSLRFAVVSSASYEHGYFNAYRHLMDRNDFGAVIHLGNYIYEYGAGEYSAGISGRDYDLANEALSTADYRARHAQYKLDEDLRKLHQQYPFITIWDDHEFANDAYDTGAENHTEGVEGLWTDRKANARQAYHEYMPIRTTSGSDSIYRTIQYGDLVKFFMLDGHSEKPIPDWASANNPGRSMLGTTQFEWLNSELTNSAAQWQVLGQSAMMAPLDINPLPFGQQYADPAQWDGYATERNSFYDSIFNNNIQNIVVLSNIGGSWANDLPKSTYNPSTGAGSAGVEFSTPSVTEPISATITSVGSSMIQSINGHAKYTELTNHGYLILDVNHIRTQSDWYFVDNITTNTSNESFAAAWYTTNNSRHLTQASGFSIPSSSQYGKLFAPSLPIVPSLDSYATISETNCFSYTSPSGNYVWTTSNTYTDTIPNTIGGDSIITVNLTINTVDLTVSQVANTLTSNEVGATYQWLNCPGMTVINGATNQSFTATSNGDYAVVVVSNNGCLDTSVCYSISGLGILENTFGDGLLIYPNPTDGHFSVDLGYTYSSIRLTIETIDGKTIESTSYQESQLLHLNLKEPAGIYLVIIESVQHKAIIRLVKE